MTESTNINAVPHAIDLNIIALNGSQYISILLH
uniref:Uncharacterized protein n=1 Tax=Setaria italica TaxID=4555 RepID=K3XTG4_SETIT